MPELPEVETTARLLRPDLVGRSIQSIDAHWARSVGERGPSFFRRGVVGAQIEAVDRRAKYVVLHLSRHGAAAGVILVHLRMSGRLYVEPTGSGLPIVDLDHDPGWTPGRSWRCGAVPRCKEG